MTDQKTMTIRMVDPANPEAVLLPGSLQDATFLVVHESDVAVTLRHPDPVTGDTTPWRDPLPFTMPKAGLGDGGQMVLDNCMGTKYRVVCRSGDWLDRRTAKRFLLAGLPFVVVNTATQSAVRGFQNPQEAIEEAERRGMHFTVFDAEEYLEDQDAGCLIWEPQSQIRADADASAKLNPLAALLRIKLPGGCLRIVAAVQYPNPADWFLLRVLVKLDDGYAVWLANVQAGKFSSGHYFTVLGPSEEEDRGLLARAMAVFILDVERRMEDCLPLYKAAAEGVRS